MSRFKQAYDQKTTPHINGISTYGGSQYSKGADTKLETKSHFDIAKNM